MCHAFIDSSSYSSWRWNVWCKDFDNKGQIKYAQYYSSQLDLSMDDLWTFYEGEEQRLDNRRWVLIQTWNRLKVKQAATKIVTHNHNIEGKKKTQFCSAEFIDLRSIKWKNSYTQFFDDLLPRTLSNVVWWCKLVKLKSLSWKCQIICNIYSASLVTVYFSSIWCKALKICINWNMQAYFKKYTIFFTK